MSVFGSHGTTHDYLPDLSLERQIEEINESKIILEEKLGVPVDHLAYSMGGFSQRIMKLTKKAGYKSAVATNRGYDKLNQDLLQLNRVRMSDDDDQKFEMWMKFSGYNNILKTLKSPYQIESLLIKDS